MTASNKEAKASGGRGLPLSPAGAGWPSVPLRSYPDLFSILFHAILSNAGASERLANDERLAPQSDRQTNETAEAEEEEEEEDRIALPLNCLSRAAAHAATYPTIFHLCE